MAAWAKKRVLITVRTYPTPARKGVETSCTAGITDDGQWIRLYPIPYRSLDEDRQFAKYQWIEAEVTKAKSDTRAESFTPNVATINIGASISTADEWRGRWQVVRPLIRPSLCGIKAQCDQTGSPTLGLFKPAKIKRLLIEPSEEPEWTTEQLAKLNQTLDLFQARPATRLEKLPFDFRYEFSCADAACSGHSLICTDWEMGQSYRSWRRQYGDGWEKAFRQRYETEMIGKYDTHFFVGNHHLFPSSWMVVGLFYPPKPAIPDLFDQTRSPRPGD